MAFLNSKEQVLEIKLTQYGKQLLAHPNRDWKPAYYTFHDNDVIYDPAHARAGNGEEQNETEDRIQNKVPQHNAQYNFNGIDNIKQFNKFLLYGDSGEERRWLNQEIIASHHTEYIERLGQFREQPALDKYYALNTPMGTSSPRSKNIPAWDVRALNNKGKIESAQHYYTGSNGTTVIPIPQLNCKIEYVISLESFDPNDMTTSEIYAESMIPPSIFGNQYINVVEDYLLLRVEEINGFLEKENFKVEIFEVEDVAVSDGDGEKTKEEIHQLFFLDDRTRFDEDGNPQYTHVEPDVIAPYHVEYYFDIEVDNEINPEILFFEEERRIKNILTDKHYLDSHGPADVKIRKDIYYGDVDPAEICD